MAILFSLMFLGVFATAIPTPAIKYPEIIPGPGLPSLSSLNVTSEELWTRALPVSAGKPIEARANFPFCGPDDAYGPVGAIAACFNYLNSLGDQPCVSSDGPRPVNYCGTADTGGKVVGIGMGRSVTNTCAEVAQGVLWVLDHCTRNELGDTAGFVEISPDHVVGATRYGQGPN